MSFLFTLHLLCTCFALGIRHKGIPEELLHGLLRFDLRFARYWTRRSLQSTHLENLCSPSQLASVEEPWEAQSCLSPWGLWVLKGSQARLQAARLAVLSPHSSHLASHLARHLALHPQPEHIPIVNYTLSTCNSPVQRVPSTS